MMMQRMTSSIWKVELVQIIPCYALCLKPWALKNLQRFKTYTIGFILKVQLLAIHYFEKFISMKEDNSNWGGQAILHTRNIESNINMHERHLWATSMVAVKRNPFIHCCDGWNVNNQCAMDDCIHIAADYLRVSQFMSMLHFFKKWLQSVHSCVFVYWHIIRPKVVSP